MLGLCMLPPAILPQKLLIRSIALLHMLWVEQLRVISFAIRVSILILIFYSFWRRTYSIIFLSLAPLASRMHMVLLFAISSFLIKQIELIRPEFADKDIGHCRGPVPNAFISLNHRYMNKRWRQEEEDLEKFV